MDEIITGRPFVGKTGHVLRMELAQQGLDIENFCYTNLWLHAKDEDACDVDWHMTQLVKELKGKKVVLLMGSDLTKTIFRKGVMDLSGLIVPWELFPKIKFIVAPNPATLFHGPMGEFRLAMKNFKEAINLYV